MRITATGILICAFYLVLQAQNEFSTEELGANVRLPTFEARLGIGFNYDLLRDPFEVSFDYPKGYFGLNLPLQQIVDLRDYSGYIDPAMDSIFADTSLFSNGDEFRPTAAARQNPNPTVRVDVPMIGGVGTFSSTQNFFINYTNALGNPNVYINPDSLQEGLSFLLRGTINVPVSMTASWETMSFGYAFEVNRYLQLAFSLHRHVFVLDLRGKIDADLLGHYNMEMPSDEASGIEVPAVEGELDYPSNKIYGDAYGHYEAETWTPTIGFKAWRFTLVTRFGIKDKKAKGRFYAKYSLPFFIDPETFQTNIDLNDPDIINSSEVRQGLLANATDSIVYSTRKKVGNSYRESDLIWNMPTGLTLSFDIIKDKLKFSYTKLFGELSMKLDRIARERVALETESAREDEVDSIVIDYGVKVDNIMILQLDLFHSFLNLGIFGLDLRYGDQENLLGSEMPAYMKLGDAAMIPVLSLGSAIGTKMQLLLELDILPLPAVKTGVFYYF